MHDQSSTLSASGSHGEGRALSRYCDYRQQLAMIDRALDQRLADGSFGR